MPGEERRDESRRRRHECPRHNTHIIHHFNAEGRIILIETLRLASICAALLAAIPPDKIFVNAVVLTMDAADNLCNPLCHSASSSFCLLYRARQLAS